GVCCRFPRRRGSPRGGASYCSCFASVILIKKARLAVEVVEANRREVFAIVWCRVDWRPEDRVAEVANDLAGSFVGALQGCRVPTRNGDLRFLELFRQVEVAELHGAVRGHIERHRAPEMSIEWQLQVDPALAVSMRF